MKIVGFFGGTFDPIHFGHLTLAIQLFEKHKLDEILFCPAFCSPHKTATPPETSGEHRLAMLRLALEAFPSQFHITTLELEREKLSYTVDTLRTLKTASQRLRLLLSDAEDLDTWKDPQELRRLAPPLMGPRCPISSTDIRERLKKKLCCAHLVPAKTLDYIQKNSLYFL